MPVHPKLPLSDTKTHFYLFVFFKWWFN